MEEQKLITELHEYLKFQGIVDEKVGLVFTGYVQSSFAPEGWAEFSKPTIFLNKQEVKQHSEVLINVYLHEVGHAIHFFDFRLDWELQLEEHEEKAISLEMKYSQVTPEYMEEYQELPLEITANVLGKELFRQLKQTTNFLNGVDKYL